MAISPGTTSGSTTYQNAASEWQPSTIAASSISGGTARKNDIISQSAMGRLIDDVRQHQRGARVVETERAERDVPRSDHRDDRDHVERERPDRGAPRTTQRAQAKRCSEYAASVATTSTIAVLAVATAKLVASACTKSERLLDEHVGVVVERRRERPCTGQDRDRALERIGQDPQERADDDHDATARSARSQPRVRAAGVARRHGAGRGGDAFIARRTDDEAPPGAQQRQHDDDRQHRQQRAVAELVLLEEDAIEVQAHELARRAGTAAREQVDLVERLEREDRRGTAARRRSPASAAAA